MSSIYKYTIVFSLGLLLGLATMYAALHRGRTDTRQLASGLTSVPSATVPRTVRIYDKAKAREQGAISKETEKAPDIDLLQAGKIKNAQGTTNVAAVLDNKTGDVSLVTNRSLAEWMSRHEAGLGYGLVDGYLAKGAQYRWTFGRISRIYGTVQAEVFEVDRSENRNPYSLMVWATWRFK